MAEVEFDDGQRCFRGGKREYVVRTILASNCIIRLYSLFFFCLLSFSWHRDVSEIFLVFLASICK